MEATDLLLHRQRLSDMTDMHYATQADGKDFAKYRSAQNKARKRE